MKLINLALLLVASQAIKLRIENGNTLVVYEDPPASKKPVSKTDKKDAKE